MSGQIEELKELALKLGISYINLKDCDISPEVLFIISEDKAKTHRFTAFDLKEDQLKVAIEDPTSLEALDVLENIKEKNHFGIDLFITSKESIDYALNLYKIFKNPPKAAEKVRLEPADSSTEFQNWSEQMSNMIKKGLSSKVSKFHIVPEKEGGNIYYQKGELKAVSSLSKENYKQAISEIKKIIGHEEQKKSQKGQFCLSLDGEKLDLEVSISSTPKGEKATIEVLGESESIYTLEKLGMREKTLEVLDRIIKKPQGMILITGLQGGGRSTTSYAILQILKNQGKKIETLENPIDCLIPGVSQTQVDPKAGLTFASGLKKILKNNPDCVMIEGLRDFETADTAVHSALVGKLIIATLNAKSAFQALSRLIDMGIDSLLLASAVNGIINQRLVLKLCPHCKQEVVSSNEIIEIVKKDLEALPFKELRSNIKLRFYSSFGCEKCKKTGFSGQIGIFEILELNEGLRSLISAKTPPEEIEKQAIGGIVTLRQDGILKTLDGETSIEEVFRAIS